MECLRDAILLRSTLCVSVVFSLFSHRRRRLRRSLSSCMAIKIKRFYVYFHIVWPNNDILNVTFGMNFIPCITTTLNGKIRGKCAQKNIRFSCNFLHLHFFHIASDVFSLKFDINEAKKSDKQSVIMA